MHRGAGRDRRTGDVPVQSQIEGSPGHENMASFGSVPNSAASAFQKTYSRAYTHTHTHRHTHTHTHTHTDIHTDTHTLTHTHNFLYLCIKIILILYLLKSVFTASKNST